MGLAVPEIISTNRQSLPLCQNSLHRTRINKFHEEKKTSQKLALSYSDIHTSLSFSAKYIFFFYVILNLLKKKGYF